MLIVMPDIVKPVILVTLNVVPVPVKVNVPDPVIFLVSELVLEKLGLVTEKVEEFSVPDDNVRVLLKVKASFNVVVIPAPLPMVTRYKVVLPLLVIVPVARVTMVNPVKVPPLDNSKLFTFIVVVPGLPVTPLLKVSLLNQLLLLITPPPHAPAVNVRLGTLVVEPFVVPNTVRLLVVAGI